ncbi:hypothetical protein [Paenibacillus radicis (ex Xue et al. 2023)]|uniref:Putative aromatic acid exporter C-terminal domain-containing protein n=1 Tax=Paenibacillus radicis (ex Xue et al. 2023) TaxID=2972489 RepID=A0ABT1YIA5_9BACL|nr:hypothetical protein [Paenibacillus radicis (ex Xue et al. 2023)]MCR8632912.1 hypothetical protein [Paenibacillus radicis (ex Xue et al. 2023)]
MPSTDKKLNESKEEVDGLIGAILNEIAAYLKDGYTLWDGKELLQLAAALNHAKSLALLDWENSLHQKDGSYYDYFEKKRQQYEVLERMLPYVSRITVQLEQGVRIGDFVLELSAHLRTVNQIQYFHESLQSIREYHKQLPMPENRNEFENRASLFAVANELEIFINLIK